MLLSIRKMNSAEAKEILGWVYEAPYSLYNMVPSESSLKELLCGNYYSASDGENNLIGYYCFGESAQVPAGDLFGVYRSKDFLDITRILSISRIITFML
jgi:hypothetical protein